MIPLRRSWPSFSRSVSSVVFETQDLIIPVPVLGLFFTSIAFAYYRQALDPGSAANSYRVPFNPGRRDNHPTHYSPPYDGTSYVPVYLPSVGPPPADGKPPEYKRASDVLFREENDAKEEDAFSDYDGPSVPMPTHWVEDRDATSPPRV